MVGVLYIRFRRPQSKEQQTATIKDEHNDAAQSSKSWPDIPTALRARGDQTRYYLSRHRDLLLDVRVVPATIVDERKKAGLNLRTAALFQKKHPPYKLVSVVLCTSTCYFVLTTWV